MRKNMRGVTSAILSISLLTVMAGAAMAPALGTIKEHFSSCSPMTVQLIVSLPALFIILTTFAFRPLCRLMRTRTLALTGLTLYVLAGAGAFFVDDIALLLVLRALLGVSVGMVMPLSTGLLSFYFPPEEQSRLMGFSAAMNQMGGVVATLLAGILASVEWRYAFLVYLAGLLAALLVAIFLPNERLNNENDNENEKLNDNDNEKRGSSTLNSKLSTLNLLRKFHPSVTAMLFIMLLFFVYPTNFALTAREQGVPMLTTTLIMVGLDVVAFVVGLLFGWLMRNLRRQMKYAAPLFFLGGYAVLAFVLGLEGMIIGSALIGLANGAGVPYVNTIASIKGGKEAAVTVMPLISAALYLGQFLSPLIVEPLSRTIQTFNYQLSIINSSNAPYLVAMCLAVLFLAQMYLTRRHQALPPTSASSTPPKARR